MNAWSSLNYRTIFLANKTNQYLIFNIQYLAEHQIKS